VINDLLEGRVALVTGGSRGIGLGIAKALLAAGAKVAISSRRPENLEQAASTLRTAFPDGHIMSFPANAGEPEQAAACVDAIMGRFGRLDILVNNAATNPHLGALADITPSQAEKTFRVNQLGPLLWTQQTLKAWMFANGGTIVNICTIGALSVDPGLGFYSSTKAGLLHITRQLAYELAPGVRVNAIAPGLVKTDMARALWEAREHEIAALLPLGRLGVPGDIGAAAVFLASDQSSWITGQMLVVDGGATVVPIDLNLGAAGN